MHGRENVWESWQWLRWRAQLNMYREQSELLDPLLEDLAGALTAGLQHGVVETGFWRGDTLRRVAPLLWALASTR